MDNPILNGKQKNDGMALFRGLPHDSSRVLLSEKPFVDMLYLERRRAERSGRPFVLMLLDGRRALAASYKDSLFRSIVKAVSASTRDTDILGWYDHDAIVGVILTELGEGNVRSSVDTVQAKVNVALRRELPLRQVNDVHLSFHVFPEKWDLEDKGGAADSKLYPDLSSRDGKGHVLRVVKRAMDITGSLVAITLLSPLFGLIAAAIRLTSKGPVLFRQRRMGLYGVSFTFLKFRSMYVNAEPDIHQSYVKQFISGQPKPESAEGIYKLRNDPRVTRVGRFLRKTSLDELPQFLNVLRGEMSLVGPRPPLPYELQDYDRWHRRRLLEARPGITGLWQVSGRSRVTFDEMVRLDLRYARTWSPWTDIKILLRTPLAVVLGEGAH